MSVNPKTVGELIREQVDRNPLASELKLQFLGINNLLPYMHLLTDLRNLKSLSLHGNSLRQLPIDLSSLNFLQSLDLSNNLFDQKKIDLTIKSLKTLPSLKILQFQMSKFLEKRMAQELKFLQYLNNTKIFRETRKEEYEFKHANEKSLQSFQENMLNYHRQLVQLQKRYLGQDHQMSVVQKFKIQLRQLSRECLQKLNQKRQNVTSSFQQLILYSTKFEMYELLKMSALNLCEDACGEVGKFLRGVLDQQDKLFKIMLQLALSLAHIELDLKEKDDEANVGNEFVSHHAIVNKNALMQKEIKRMRRQNEEYQAEINQLEAHCKKLNDAMCRHVKGIEQPERNAALTTFRVETDSNAYHASKTSESEKKLRGSVGVQRCLTLKQMKDIIEEIYEAKSKFDEKNYNSKIARETMNQYIFTHLNQKYGLKSLTIEAANSIVSGIQMHSASDNDVAVFGKILRNEVDEEFRLVQKQLKSSINNLIKMTIKEKMPLKSTVEINEILNQRIQGEILFEEGKYIINYLFHEKEATQIFENIKKNIQKNRQSEVQSRRKVKDQSESKEKNKVKYSQFLQQILNFQLKYQQKKLKPLIVAFKKRDNDADGIINEEEFIQIIQSLSQSSSNLIPNLLNIVDPYETKKITFSEMARLVTNYPQRDPIINQVRRQNQQQIFIDQNVSNQSI